MRWRAAKRVWSYMQTEMTVASYRFPLETRTIDDKTSRKLTENGNTEKQTYASDDSLKTSIEGEITPDKPLLGLEKGPRFHLAQSG